MTADLWTPAADSLIPWWAVSLCDFAPGSDHYRVRRRMQEGIRPAGDAAWTKGWRQLWTEVVIHAQTHVMQRTMDEWVKEAPDLCRKAALSSSRAFVQFCKLEDDDQEILVLKDFHVKTIRALRENYHALVLLPFSHGKSFLTNIVIPLMDWAENPECTQIRIFYNEEFTSLWTRQLMSLVADSKPLHDLFPWVRKPTRDDPCGKRGQEIWSTKAFAIGGKTQVSPSFRSGTWAAGTTGLRGDRVICDDWVNDEVDESVAIQERQMQYMRSGVNTMTKPRLGKAWWSPYGTKWGTIGVDGTIFHNQDYNSRLKREWQGKEGKKVLRVDIYPNKDSKEKKEVIWPEKRPWEWVEALRENLGDRAFNMRCRNLPGGARSEIFRRSYVEAAIDLNAEYGAFPIGTKESGKIHAVIGFDPATGRRTRYTKFPAAMLLAFVDETVHFVKWERFADMAAPEQCDRLIGWAREYGCKIVVEDNQTQASMAEWIQRVDPSIDVVCFTTGSNKRDPFQGVEQFQTYFNHGTAVIHAKNCPPDLLKALVSEFCDYPQGKTTDLVMASWFARHQYDLMMKQTSNENLQFENPMPSWLSGRGRDRQIYGSIDIRKYKEPVF